MVVLLAHLDRIFDATLLGDLDYDEYGDLSGEEWLLEWFVSCNKHRPFSHIESRTSSHDDISEH